jgi:undecaprenyl-diphosphatase
MELLQLTILSLVQGLTEFLPISSSAHLILVSSFMHWPDQGLTIDIFAHFGTLLAVIFYFRDDLIEIIKNFNFFEKNNLGVNLCVATVPIAIVGFIFKDFIEINLRSEEVIFWSTLIFGIVLIFSDKFSSNQKDLSQISLRDSLLIGFFQIFALMPGSSRSAVTMIGALFLGYTKSNAAKFSFLLAVPTLSIVFFGELVSINQEIFKINYSELIYVASVSFLSAICCIHFFLKLIEKVGFVPFGIYRIFLAGFILVF